jgi:hypothetical protein
MIGWLLRAAISLVVGPDSEQEGPEELERRLREEASEKGLAEEEERARQDFVSRHCGKKIRHTTEEAAQIHCRELEAKAKLKTRMKWERDIRAQSKAIERSGRGEWMCAAHREETAGAHTRAMRAVTDRPTTAARGFFYIPLSSFADIFVSVNEIFFRGCDLMMTNERMPRILTSSAILSPY